MPEVWYTEAMETVYFILLLLGALCFAGAALGRAAVDANRGAGVRSLGLLPLGLLFWILVPMIQTGRVVF